MTPPIPPTEEETVCVEAAKDLRFVSKQSFAAPSDDRYWIPAELIQGRQKRRRRGPSLRDSLEWNPAIGSEGEDDRSSASGGQNESGNELDGEESEASEDKAGDYAADFEEDDFGGGDDENDDEGVM